MAASLPEQCIGKVGFAGVSKAWLNLATWNCRSLMAPPEERRAKRMDAEKRQHKVENLARSVHVLALQETHGTWAQFQEYSRRLHLSHGIVVSLLKAKGSGGWQ